MNSDASTPMIFVVIVTYNGIRWIDKCLESIKKSTNQPKVIVVDNASTDTTQEFIVTNYPEFQLLVQQQNLGFGKANNLGIKEALKQGAEYVLLLNQDAYLSSNTIELLVKSFEEENDHIGVISPVHYAMDGTLDFGFEDHINRYASPVSKKAIETKDGQVVEVGFVNAACWMLSRNTIEKVGGFNPLFPHYGEDNDYINRMIFHKMKVCVLTSASIIHDRKQTHTTVFQKVKRREEVAFLKHLSNINLTYFQAWRKSIDKLFRETTYYFFKLSWQRVVAIKLGFVKVILNIQSIKIARSKSKQKGAYL